MVIEEGKDRKYDLEKRLIDLAVSIIDVVECVYFDIQNSLFNIRYSNWLWARRTSKVS